MARNIVPGMTCTARIEVQHTIFIWNTVPNFSMSCQHTDRVFPHTHNSTHPLSNGDFSDISRPCWVYYLFQPALGKLFSHQTATNFVLGSPDAISSIVLSSLLLVSGKCFQMQWFLFSPVFPLLVQLTRKEPKPKFFRLFNWAQARERVIESPPWNSHCANTEVVTVLKPLEEVLRINRHLDKRKETERKKIVWPEHIMCYRCSNNVEYDKNTHTSV